MEDETKPYLLLLGGFKIICFIVFLLFIGYCLWILYKDRNEHYRIFYKRRPNLIISLVIVTILPIISSTFIESYTCVFKFCSNIPRYHQTLFGLISYVLQMILITSRVWFIFYDIKYYQCILSHKWWQTINHNQFNNFFFIKNRYKYGSLTISGNKSNHHLSTMTKIILIFMVLWIAQICITAQIDDGLNSFLYILVCNLLWLIQLCCFCKMKFYDEYCIRKEIQRLAIFYFIGSIYFGTAYAVFVPNSQIMAWITAFITYLNASVTVSICTLWPYYDNKRRKQNMHQTDKAIIGKKQFITWQEYGVFHFVVFIFLSSFSLSTGFCDA